jgi:hypothetical protein
MKRKIAFAAPLIFTLFCDTSYAEVTLKALAANVKTEKASVNLSEELNSFFRNSGCSLPTRLTKKLDDIDKAYIPAELKQMLTQDLTSTVDKYSGQSVLRVLNTALFLDDKSNPKQMTLTGAETYTVYDPLRNMDMQTNNFAYALDCSGLLNSSISIAGGLSGKDGAMAAKSALEMKKSMLAVKASVFSPIAVALSPDIGGSLTRRQRISVLYALSREVNRLYPNAPETTKISSGKMVPAIWTSSAGASSFQGQSSLLANAGANIGIFAASANVAGNATFSKSVSFSQFDTYILNSQEVATVDSDLKTVNDVAVQLVNGSSLIAPVRRIDSSYQAVFDLPIQVCGKTWVVKSFKSTGTQVPGTVQTAWTDQRGCEINITPASALANDEIALVLETQSDLKPDVKFTLTAPIH